MPNEPIILFTGQSGVRIQEALQRLKNTLQTETEVISIEERIWSEELCPKRRTILDFISLPQKHQYEIWTRTFMDSIYPKVTDSPAASIFLTFHAVYYHQKKRELYPPVNYEALALLRDRVKMIVVLVDDIFDVYRQLMDRGQMFEDYGPDDEADDEKKKKSMLVSVFNIISLLNWREMEIAVSRSIANYLGVPIYVISTRHPISIFVKLVECALDDLSIFYLSHPITIIREEATERIPSFVGRLENLIRSLIREEKHVLFYPTSIDELIIKKANGEYYPELIPRWPDAYPPEDLLCSPIGPDLKRINPLNPKSYDIAADENTQKSISSLLSLLWDFIYSKQIISRDFTLVEQSKDGIVICRPYYGGEAAGGVMGELEYCCTLMDEMPRRKCIVLSCKNDWNKMVINRLFTSLEDTLKDPHLRVLRSAREDWISKNADVLDRSIEEIKTELEKDVLGQDYDFLGEAASAWEGDELEQKRRRQKAGMREILESMDHDRIAYIISEHVKSDEAKERVFYNRDIIEADFWDNIHGYIKECVMNGEES